MSSSSDLQQQDLAIYDGSRITTDTIGQLNLILSAESTKPTWLNVGLVESCLLDRSYLSTATQHAKYTLDAPKASVIFASFVNDTNVYARQFKRFIGLDLDHINCAQFKFISFLKDGADNWFETIQREVAKLRGPITIFLEDPEFALYLTDTSVDGVLKSLNSLNKSTNLYLIMPLDKPVLDYSEIQDDLSTVYMTFLMKLIHRSHLILSLRPLTTGRADDVTGELIINRGLIGEAIMEREYIYLVSKDGNTKLFYR